MSLTLKTVLRVKITVTQNVIVTIFRLHEFNMLFLAILFVYYEQTKCNPIIMLNFINLTYITLKDKKYYYDSKNLNAFYPSGYGLVNSILYPSN